MAEIVRAEIVGIRTAENGSGGYTINSTDYSVLVFYSNGSVELIEGDARQIHPYLQYMIPRDSIDQLMPLFNQFEAKIKEDILTIVNDVLFEYRNPLPVGMTGKDMKEAKSILEEGGFKVVCTPIMPEGTSGIVMECSRKHDDLMTVVLKIKYCIPSVIGMDTDVAIKKLTVAGFVPTIKSQLTSDPALDNKAFRVERDLDSLNVVLWVYSKNENAFEFLNQIQDYDSMIDIWKAWEKAGLAEIYPDITEYIKTKKEFERLYGKLSDFEKKKQEIKAMLQ